MGETPRVSTRSRVILIAITSCTIGFLIWSLRDFKLHTLITDLREMNWWWVALAIAADIAVYTCQAWRWRTLLRPIEPVSFWKTVQAIYIALFGNEVLGFNAGEVVRSYLMSRWTSLPFSVSVSSVLIERIFDGVWLSGAMFLALRLVPRPRHMRLLIGSQYVLAAVVVLGLALLAVAMFHRHRARELLGGRSWQRHLRVLIDDLSLIGHSRYLYFAFLQSLLYLALQTVPIYASFRGYGFDDLGWKDAFALAIIVRLGSAVPQAPGNIGIYLLMRQILVTIFRVFPRDAENFSMVFWGIITLRLIIGGIMALTVTGASFGQLRREAHEHREELAKSRQ